MKFLKKIGKIGGAANKDFSFTIGLDEGPAGNTQGAGGKVSKNVRTVYWYQYIHLHFDVAAKQTAKL